MNEQNALMTLDATASSALAGFNSAAGNSGLMPFPVTMVKDGAFKPHKEVPDDIKDMLPDGSKGFTGIFLTYRLGVIAWQVGFDDRTDENKSPAFMGFAPANDATLGKLIGAAGKDYHFTKKDAKREYDFATSNVGHVQPLIEILAFIPSLNSLGVISTPSNYNSTEETTLVLKSLVSKETGAIPQAPMVFSPQQAHKKTKSWEWDVDYIGISNAPLTPATQQVLEQYKAWSESAKEDLALKADLETWLTCSDHPIDDNIRAALNKAIGLVPRSR